MKVTLSDLAKQFSSHRQIENSVPAVVGSPFLSIVHEVHLLAVVVLMTRELCGHAPGEHSGLYLGLHRHPFPADNEHAAII